MFLVGGVIISLPNKLTNCLLFLLSDVDIWGLGIGDSFSLLQRPRDNTSKGRFLVNIVDDIMLKC